MPREIHFQLEIKEHDRRRIESDYAFQVLRCAPLHLGLLRKTVEAFLFYHYIGCSRTAR